MATVAPTRTMFLEELRPSGSPVAPTPARNSGGGSGGVGWLELALLPEPRPKARNLPTRYGARDVGAQANRIRLQGQLSLSRADGSEVAMSKSSDKPKKQQKQKPQKTLKERRSEKRAAKKFGSGPLLPADK
jgi:hypothetical protein